MKKYGFVFFFTADTLMFTVNDTVHIQRSDLCYIHERAGRAFQVLENCHFMLFNMFSNKKGWNYMTKKPKAKCAFCKGSMRWKMYLDSR